MSIADINAGELGSGLIAAAKRWQRLSHIAMALGEFGISDACALPLLSLMRMGANVHQVELAKAAGIVGSSLVRLLDQMSAQGLIQRLEDPQDRRANIVSLTDQGMKVAQSLEQRLAELHSRLLAGFSDEELSAAYRVIDALQRRTVRNRPSSLPSPGD